MIHSTPQTTLFPYTTLFRSQSKVSELKNHNDSLLQDKKALDEKSKQQPIVERIDISITNQEELRLDRLRSEEHTSNSSHVAISYAVFCLKKKNSYKHEDTTK